MLFNSWTFWLFFALVFPCYWGLPFRWQNAFLIVASYVFYGWWDWRFLPLIAFSTVMDYALGRAIAAAPTSRSRHRLVVVSVVVNLALLGVFKYYNFFAAQLLAALGSVGVTVSLPVLNIILPVGISFYTFQSMSYVIDIARGVTKPAERFQDFALYVCFFPHLVAGPIMRSGSKDHDPLGRGLLKQLAAPRVWTSATFEQGLYHVSLGLFKKVVVGDNMATIANMVFSTPVSRLSGPECLIGIYAFAWQIYADFSGYSSIAQGLAKWLGIDLMFNFRMPYLSATPSEFWRRWHISLSTWLRDYLYVPLGGSRGGTMRTYRNLIMTMVLGGLWHGANWTFVLWGLFHGVILCVYRPFEDRSRTARVVEMAPRRVSSLFRKVLPVVVMFHLACAGWLLFRATSVGQAAALAVRVVTDFTWTPTAKTVGGLLLFYALPLFLFELWVERRQSMTALLETSWPARGLAYAAAAVMLIVFSSPIAHDFIYFQF